MIAGSLEIQLFANIARLQTDMNKANSVVSKAMGGVEKSVQLAKNALGGLGLGLIAREAVQMTDAYTKMDAQLRNATESEREFAKAKEDVHRISSIAQADISAITSLYGRFTPTMKENGAAQQDIADVAETVALSLKVMGASAQEQSSAMLQLSQAFGSGRLAGEEFKAMSESAPNLMRALAKSMDVPYGSLKKLAAEGKITSKVLQEAFTDPALLESLRVQAEAMSTISGAWQELKNEVTLFVGEAGKTSGAASAIADSISLIAKNIDTLAMGLEAVAVVMATRYVASLVAGAQASYTKIASAVALAKAEQTLAAVELEAAAAASAHAAAYANQARIVAASTPGFYLSATAVAELAAAEAAATATATAHTVALGRMTVATTAASGATRILNGTLALVGGTVGAGFLVAAGGAYLFVNAAKKAAEQADAVVTSITNIIDTFATMDEAALTAEIAAMEKTIAKTEQLLVVSEGLAAETGLGADKIRALNVQLQAETDTLGLLERQLAGVKDGTRTVKGETEGLADAAGEASQKVAELIQSLVNQNAMLGMSNREQAIFEERLKALAAGAGPEAIATIEALAAQNYDLEESLKPVTNAAQDLIDNLSIQQAQLGMTARELAIYNAHLEAGEKATAAEIIQIDAKTIALYEQAAAVTELAEFTEAANEAMDEYNADRADAKSSLADIQKQIELIGNQSKAVEAQYDLAHGAHERWTQDEKEEYLALLERLEVEEAAHEIYLEQEREAAQVRKQLLKGLQNTLADALRAGTKEGADDALDIFTDMLADMSTQWVAAQLMDFGASFVNGGKQESGGFDWGGAISAAMGIFGGGGAPAAANEGLSAAAYVSMMDGFAGMKDGGGDVAAGNWAIAGEKGPEIVKGPATVVSRKDTAAMMSSSNTTIAPVIHIHGIKDQKTANEAASSMRRAMNGLMAANQRNA
jgi:tape measure domain-containing protein